jgi:radical SAM superfamily enzyme YgiQ (UPF0313 family)
MQTTKGIEFPSKPAYIGRMVPRRKVLLIQLPIPPAGIEAVRGNVPLATGYVKLAASRAGLDRHFDIEILPARQANQLSDQALVRQILARDPWMVGFTCYLWNIDRSLWVASRLKQARPELLVLIGGPEVTADNAWVLSHPSVDFAAVGEGEQTFCDLLASLSSGSPRGKCIPGLSRAGLVPMPRKPLSRLDDVSSPYLAGILDAADERMLLLETIRGCVFKCKFCFYPKSYDGLYFLSREKIVANLRHARERGASEVVLLDPTLNQRKDFDAFVQLLADENPDRQFTYFGELRAEGIRDHTARLLRKANFTEVEIGLQSIEPRAMDLMDRGNNLRAFERGVRALLDAGIQVKVDLIVGLPGDTVDSVRRGIDYLHASGLYSSVQVFNLAVLPGTAFRQEAAQLGLVYSPRTPYYVLRTPTLGTEDLFDLMSEAQEAFGIEFDPLPPPVVPEVRQASGGRQPPGVFAPHQRDASNDLQSVWHVDLDDPPSPAPNPDHCTQAFTLWLRSGDFHARRHVAAERIAELLAANPHTTLQILLEPTGNPRSLTPTALDRMLRACYAETSYLDRFYSILPGRPKGAKRLVVLLPASERTRLGRDWIDAIGDYASIVWRGESPCVEDMEPHEFAMR